MDELTDEESSGESSEAAARPGQLPMTRRQLSIAGVGLMGAALLPGCVSHPAASKHTLAAVESFRENAAAPGGQISVVKGGNQIISTAFGFADLATQAKVQTNTVLPIASVTKQFVGAGLLALQDDGLLSVGDPLAEHIEDFPSAAEITLRDIATHTAGLGSYTDLPSLPSDSVGAYSPAEHLALMRRTSPLFVAPPRTRTVYSNTGYGLLTRVIESASGMSFSEFARVRLFEPAGLQHTSVGWSADPALDNIASGYTTTATGDFVRAQIPSASYVSGAGNILSTCQDLTRWHGALLREQVISRRSLQEMRSGARLMDGSVSDYGFGIDLTVASGPFRGEPAISHDGGMPGYASRLRTLPQASISAAVLLNCDGQNQPEFNNYLNTLVDDLIIAASGIDA